VTTNVIATEVSKEEQGQLATIIANQTALTKAAEASVLIVSGSLRREMYDDEGLHKAMLDALKKGVDFTVIVGPEYATEGSERMISALLAHPRTACLYCLAARPPVHFSVVDGLHVRYEGPHATEDQPVNEVCFNVPEVASTLLALGCEMMTVGRAHKVEQPGVK